VRLTLVRDRVTLVTYAQLGVFGYFIYGFGPVVPLLRDEQGTSRAVASLHGSALAVAAIVGGLTFPWLVGRFGRPRVLWGGVAGLAVGVLALWVARPFPATMTATFVAALAGSLVVNGVVATLSDHHREAGSAAISEANAVAAGVGTVSPLIVGASVTVGFGWRPGLAALVLAAAGVALVGWLSRDALSTRTAAPAPTGTLRGKLPPTYWLAWFSMLATGSVEVCLNLWAGDELRTHANVAPGVATAALSAIVGGMFVGRLFGVRLLLRIAAPRVLLGALAVSAAGFTVFWLSTTAWLAILGLLICGLGNALHYPLAVALAVGNSNGQPDLAAARTAYAMGFGFGVAPFVLGWVADRVGTHLAFLLVYAMLAAAAGAVWRLLPLSRLPLSRDGDAVGDGQEHRVHPGVGANGVVELGDRPVVGRSGGEHPPAA
jgi:fucose permease